MLEKKIKKTLTPLLVIAFSVVSLQSMGLYAHHVQSYFSNNIEGRDNEDPKPMVLGAFTDTRGELLPEKPQSPILSVPLDISKIKAKSFLVYDVGSGATLAEKNSTDQLSIASITKLLTGLVAYENLNLNEPIVISGQFTSIRPIVGAKQNDSIKGLDIFDAMLVGSCNDAAQILALATATAVKKDFISLMNQKAQSLGMVHSHFGNPIGFEDSNTYSTAEDLKLLVSEVQNYEAFTSLGKKTSYAFQSLEGNKYLIPATNKLVANNADVEAIKTGYTDVAGGAMITKASAKKHKIIIIVLDTPSREQDTLNLKDEIFKDFIWNE